MIGWYDDLLNNILSRGTISAPRGKKTRELFDQQLVITEPLFWSAVRDVNYRFAVAEAIWIAAGFNDLACLTRYNSRMAEFSDDGKRLVGAYGPRFRAQWPEVKAKLKEPHTRQAVVTIFDDKDLRAVTKDLPCTLSWQFQIRDGKLHMTANMRSSDAWLGVPYDVFSFWMVGNCVAGELGVRMASLTMNLANSHLYEPHWEPATKVVCSNETTYHPLRRLPGLPPATVEQALLTGTCMPAIVALSWAPYYACLVAASKLEAWTILRKSA